MKRMAMTMIAVVVGAVLAMGGALADEDIGFADFGGVGGPAKEAFFLATNDAEWQKLWALVGREPRSEFKNGKTGIGVFLGARPVGDRLSVRKVQDDDGRIEVKLRHRRGKNTGEMASPWVIVLAHGSSNDVVVDVRHDVSSKPD